MNKKKLLISLMLLLLFLVACQKSNDANEISETIHIADTLYNNEITIYYQGDPQNLEYEWLGYEGIDLQSCNRWSEYVLNISGTKVIYDLYDYEHPYNFGETIDSNHMIYVDMKERLDYLIDNNKVVPINDYLNEIKGSSVISEEALRSFTDEQGNIWALPTYIRTYYTGQIIYRSDWMNQLNREVPFTLEEYLTLARDIKLSNYELNSEKEVYIDVIQNYGNLLSQYLNIFTAYGCYPSINYYTMLPQISYNQTTNEYEDIVLNEGFIKAMTYIQLLLREGLVLDGTSMTQEQLMENYEFCCGISNNDSEWLFGQYLTGDNEEQLIYQVNTVVGIAILKDTQNIKEKLDFFINQVFHDEELLVAFNYGLIDEHIKSINGEYYIQGELNPGSYRYFPQISVNMVTDIRRDKPLFRGGSSNEEYLKLISDGAISYAKYIDVYNDIEQQTNLIYYYDERYNLPYDASQIAKHYENTFNRLLEEILKNDVDVETAVNSYINDYNNNGYREYVETLNEQ